MDFQQFLSSSALSSLQHQAEARGSATPTDYSRAARIEIGRELYLEADSRGLTLTELLELEEYDPTPAGATLDAFERQLALAGIRLDGKSPSTVEMFYQQAPALLPEFMRREINKGQAMRPELSCLVANSTSVSANTYTPFFIDTSSDTKFSLRPIGEGAEVPQLLVTEQKHGVKVMDYGLALKTSYKALRYRTTSQFRVLLWYIGFKIQTDKIGMVVDTIINGDGNDNAATVIDTAASGVLTYDDLINLWS